MAVASQPWMKFYPQDWRADEKLRMCSLAARGLWIEMLAIMHRSERYGQLLIGGRVPTDAQLAVQVGASPSEVTALLAELGGADVFSRTASGAIYSRRMTRDQKKADTARKNGKKGGNPTLGNKTGNSASVKGSDNPSVKGGVKAQIPEARGQNTPLPPKADPPPKAESGKEYVFEGRTIRVDRKQFELWREAYHCIPDVRAELQGLDDWLQGPNVPDAKRQNWFHLVSNNLRRKHEERAGALRDQQAADAAFLRRHPPQKFTEAEARALMSDADFDRWRARQSVEQ